MSIIEQAARRLEQLRNSGIEVTPLKGATPASVATEALPARATRRLEEAQRPTAAAPVAAERAPRINGTHRSKVVEVDLARLASMGYVSPTAGRAQVADDFRVIKRRLLSYARDKASENGNLIMVTSSLPEEGKTFVAVNLAMSIAMELDHTVLLVDADVSRPSVLSRLGLPSSGGLLDVLADPSIDLSEVLLRTNIDKLSLLPAGAPRAHATEMLSSESMDRVLSELATRYQDRIVVFDAPPLLPSTESRAVATRMGQVILVVEAKRTPQRAVVQALSTIEDCPVVLPLLNKANRSELGHYYGYYGLDER
ncbi:MAG TPA: XrtA-associated tyrosine autokinase [Caldimonas sp.]|nr:XrtA-associated tyrosine autokinase [Caldimonas sp.]